LIILIVMKLSILVLLLGVASCVLADVATQQNWPWPPPQPKCYEACQNPPCPLTACQYGWATVGDLQDMQNGACMYEGVVNTCNVAGISGYCDQQVKKCGNCFQVTGPKGSEVVVITDLTCKYSSPFCSANPLQTKFNLSPQTFQQISGQTDGSVAISFREVDCPCSLLVADYKPKLHIQSGSTPYWMAMSPYNTQASIDRFWVSIKGVKTELFRDPVNGRFVFNGVTPSSFPFNVWMWTAFAPTQFIQCAVNDLSNSEIPCQTNCSPIIWTGSSDCKLGSCPLSGPDPADAPPKL